MTRSEIVRNILKDVIWRIYPNPANEDDRNQFFSTIDSSIEDACDDLREPEYAHLLSDAHRCIITEIERCIALLDYFNDAVQEPNVPKYFKYQVNDKEDITYLLRFITKSSPYVITSVCFWKNDAIREDLSSNSDLWDAILRLWQNILPNSVEAAEFWELLETYHDDSYYLAVDGAGAAFADKNKAWTYFAYGYLTKVNDDKFPIPEKLCITSSAFKFKEPLTFVANAKYDQFFDAYNVLNEVKHAGDKLTRYLKTYHIVEQFAYRAKFIKLVNARQEQDCSLVRRLEALTDTFKRTETETIVQSIQSLFPNVMQDLNSQIGLPGDVLTVDCRKFLKDKYQVEAEEGALTYSAKSVGLIIYNLRNSIVHNKETEFHLTYNNVSEYECIIDLIEFLYNSLIDGIIILFEKTRKNKVTYRRKTLKLY